MAGNNRSCTTGALKLEDFADQRTGREFRDNKYVYHQGDPNSDVVYVIAVGSGQSPNDNTATRLVADPNSGWSNYNVYGIHPELPRSTHNNKRIDGGYSEEALGVLSQAHYNNMQELFPNAERYVVVGYSAGGYLMPSMVRTIQENGKEVAGIVGADPYPNKGKQQPAFDAMVKDARDAGTPILIAISGGGAGIAKRTAERFGNDRTMQDSVVSIPGSGHGNICESSVFRSALNSRIVTPIQIQRDAVYTADGVDIPDYSVPLAEPTTPKQTPAPKVNTPKTPTTPKTPIQKPVQQKNETETPQGKPASKQLTPMATKAAIVKAPEPVKIATSKSLSQPKVTTTTKPVAVKEAATGKTAQKVVTPVKTQAKQTAVAKTTATKATSTKAPVVKPATTRALPDLSSLKSSGKKACVLEI